MAEAIGQGEPQYLVFQMFFPVRILTGSIFVTGVPSGPDLFQENTK
jgi:hypothetical protein